jgi:thiamine-monophosphate kinase
MGRGGEFDRIRALLGSVVEDPRLRVGPGDDAAVIGDLVVSTDLTVEDVHFRRAWLTLEEVGHRAVTVALSDLGAMGAEPVAVLLSLALPDRDRALAAATSLGGGARAAAEAAGATLAGGDLTRSPGPLVADVVVLGRASAPVLRSTARAGDDLWVTGVLGGSAGAVEAWMSGSEPSPELRRRFAAPSPPLTLLRDLGSRTGITAALDLSDGLLADAGHLAAASGLRARVEVRRVPVDPALAGMDEAEAMRLALEGGEDYQLLFAAPRDARASLEAPGAIRLTRVGELTPGQGVLRVEADGREVEVHGGGFDHFAGSSS